MDPKSGAKDIVKLERIQRRATKYTLNDFISDYKSRLSSLDFLPLMYEFELCDILFCIRCLRSPAEHFNIKNWITFSTNVTRSGSQQRMCHSRSTSIFSRNTYFNRLPRLWNSLPPLSLLTFHFF